MRHKQNKWSVIKTVLVCLSPISSGLVKSSTHRVRCENIPTLQGPFLGLLLFFLFPVIDLIWATVSHLCTVAAAIKLVSTDPKSLAVFRLWSLVHFVAFASSVIRTRFPVRLWWAGGTPADKATSPIITSKYSTARDNLLTSGTELIAVTMVIWWPYMLPLNAQRVVGYCK